jgi:hypothetical protein
MWPLYLQPVNWPILTSTVKPFGDRLKCHVKLIRLLREANPHVARMSKAIARSNKDAGHGQFFAKWTAIRSIGEPGKRSGSTARGRPGQDAVGAGDQSLEPAPILGGNGL